MGMNGLKKNGGFSIVEILVALEMSSILLPAFYQTFLNQQRTYTV